MNTTLSQADFNEFYTNINQVSENRVQIFDTFVSKVDNKFECGMFCFDTF